MNVILTIDLFLFVRVSGNVILYVLYEYVEDLKYMYVCTVIMYTKYGLDDGLKYHR